MYVGRNQAQEFGVDLLTDESKGISRMEGLVLSSHYLSFYRLEILCLRLEVGVEHCDCTMRLPSNLDLHRTCTCTISYHHFATQSLEKFIAS